MEMSGYRSKKFLIISMVIAVLILSATTILAETDVTSMVKVTYSNAVYDRVRGTTSYDVTLTNISQQVLLTPMKVVIDSISSSAVTVANADGITADGKPYLDYSLVCSDNELAPGEKSFARRIYFNNGSRIRFTFQIAIHAELSTSRTPTATPIISETISATEGGHIVINDPGFFANGFEMIIPPGALAEDTTITISELSSNLYKNQNVIGLNLPLDFAPSGLQFLKPVTIKIPYSKNALFESGNPDLTYAYLVSYNALTNAQEIIPIKSIDTVNGKIIAEITHFSIWEFLCFWRRETTDWDKEVRHYVSNVWKIACTPDELSQALINEDLLGVPLKTTIGAFLAAPKIYDDLKNKDYKGAAITAGGLGIKKGLSAFGFPYLATVFGFGLSTYNFFDYMIDELDDGAFNAQVSYYVWYVTEEGLSEQEFDDVGLIEDGWLINPKCPYGQTHRPILRDAYTLENVFSVGKQIVNINILKNNIGDEEAELRDITQEAIEKVLAASNPIANINIQPGNAGNIPFTITVDASGSFPKIGRLVSYQWDFGDGVRQSGVVSLQHTYEHPGNYTVALVVTDDQGRIGKCEKKIYVTTTNLANEAPVAAYTYTLGANNEVHFDASGSIDYDGQIIKYEWLFGDFESGSDATVAHTYENPGVYPVTLRVTDNDFAVTKITQHITIPSPSESVNITWTKKADMPVLTGGTPACINGKVYVLGGWDSNLVYEYDPSSDTWAKRASMPSARGGTVALPFDGKIYVAGGNPVPYGSPNLNVYDPQTDSWQNRSPMPNYLWGGWGIAGGVVNSKLYAIGGYNWPDHEEDYCREYNIATDSWLLKSPMPTAVEWMNAAVYNDKIYVVGGQYGTGSWTLLNYIQAYNPSDDTWDIIPGLPVYLADAGVVAYNNKLYIFGGKTASPPFPVTLSQKEDNLSIFSYDFNSGIFTKEGDMPTKDARQVCLISNKIYLIGAGENGRETWEGLLGE